MSAVTLITEEISDFSSANSNQSDASSVSNYSTFNEGDKVYSIVNIHREIVFVR